MILVDYIESTQFCKITTDEVNNDWLEIRFHYNQISNQSEIFDDSIELPWHSFASNLSILSLIISYYKIEISFSNISKKLLEDSIVDSNTIENIDSIIPITVPEITSFLNQISFNRELTEHQLRNVSKLSRLNYGATFSVPGAGKTTEAIAFYLLKKKNNESLFVISPKNAFAAWEEQFQICLKEKSPKIIRLTNGIEKIEYDLTNNKNCVFLISYQQFIRVVNSIASFLHNNKSFVFIDESHRMKRWRKVRYW